MTATLTIYGKPECHLCDEALAVLRPLVAELGFALREVDITTDDALHARYLERIPVVALDGEELYDFCVNVPDLRRRLARVQDR